MDERIAFFHLADNAASYRMAASADFVPAASTVQVPAAGQAGAGQSGRQAES